MRPLCISEFTGDSGAALYGANIIAQYTRDAGDQAADVSWLLSTWNPYAVVLVKTRVELGAN